jgi:hypothetical protein
MKSQERVVKASRLFALVFASLFGAACSGESAPASEGPHGTTSQALDATDLGDGPYESPSSGCKTKIYYWAQANLLLSDQYGNSACDYAPPNFYTCSGTTCTRPEGDRIVIVGRGQFNYYSGQNGWVYTRVPFE